MVVLVATLVFSAALAIPAQITHAKDKVQLVVSRHDKGVEGGPNTDSVATAECGPGEILTGGGFGISLDEQPTVGFSRPEGNAWSVGIFNHSDDPTNFVS